MFMRRILALGFVIWLGATALLRAVGQYIVPATPVATLLLFAATFPAMAWLARRVCRTSGLPPAEWPLGALALAAPTLLFDPFTSAFFPLVFPNMRADLAGVFGGWMLLCVAGAMYGGARRA
jgi:hypothetical protein